MQNDVPGGREIVARFAAFRTLEGDGFEVQRAIPTAQIEAIGPFIFLDQFGPIKVGPGEALGASAHPHTGIETLSLLIEGRFQHKDSLGNKSAMGPGDVQWMRAGSGIVHDEGPDDVMRRDGGVIHGVQLWLNMPGQTKLDPPAYRHVGTEAMPVLAGRAARARLVAGAAGDARGPIETNGQPFVAHVSLNAGGAIEIDAAAPEQLAAYVMLGAARIGETPAPVEAGTLAVLSPGSTVRIAAAIPTELLLIGGAPIDAPIVRHGPFVTNSEQEMHQAIRRYQAGLMGEITV